LLHTLFFLAISSSAHGICALFSQGCLFPGVVSLTLCPGECLFCSFSALGCPRSLRKNGETWHLVDWQILFYGGKFLILLVVITSKDICVSADPEHTVTSCGQITLLIPSQKNARVKA
jgi:hypothetical protein